MTPMKCPECGKDLPERAMSCQNCGCPKQYFLPALEDINVGSHVTLGRWGDVDIEWRVLDVHGSYALLLTEWGIDCQKYNEFHLDCTWSECSLREWLNGEFLSSAFSDAERSLVKQVRAFNRNNEEYSTPGGPDTTDHVFLLSINEVQVYFRGDDDRRCHATRLARNNGVWTSTYDNACYWWLRSPGAYADFAAGVQAIGHIGRGGSKVIDDETAVRPALWICLQANDAEHSDAAFGHGQDTLSNFEGSLFWKDERISSRDDYSSNKDQTTEKPFDPQEFFMAAAQNDVGKIAYLRAKYDFDINIEDSDGDTALYWAAMKGSTDTINLLLEYGADPNHSGAGLPLYIAMAGKHESAAVALIRGGADLSIRRINPTTPETPLMLASFLGLLSVVKELIRQGVDVNERDDDGDAAIDYFALGQTNKARVAAALLLNGADINRLYARGYIFESIKNGSPYIYRKEEVDYWVLIDDDITLGRLTAEGMKFFGEHLL